MLPDALSYVLRSRASLVPTAFALAAVAAFLLPLDLLAAGSLESLVTYVESGDNGHTHEQTSTTASSLSDQIAAILGQSSVTVTYGGIHLSGAAACPIAEPSGLAASYASSSILNDTFAINVGGAPGDTGKAHFILHLGGAVQGSSDGQGFWNASYELQVNGAGSTSVSADYTCFNSTTEHNGSQPGKVGTFTMDVPFAVGGSPVTLQASMNQQLHTGSTNAEATPTGSGRASVDLTFSLEGFSVLNSAGKPMNYTAESTTGSARGLIIPAHSSFKQFTVTNQAPGRFGTALTLLDGTASISTAVNAAFVAPPPPRRDQAGQRRGRPHRDEQRPGGRANELRPSGSEYRLRFTFLF